MFLNFQDQLYILDPNSIIDDLFQMASFIHFLSQLICFQIIPILNNLLALLMTQFNSRFNLLNFTYFEHYL